MATTSPTCPHGSLGDFSCDGYLRITRAVFACYAPKSEYEIQQSGATMTGLKPDGRETMFRSRDIKR